MAVFTGKELDELLGRGSGYTPSYPQTEYIPKPVFPVSIQEQIYNAVLSAERAVTRGEIAKALGRKPSSWLNGRIDALWQRGYLRRTEYTWHNGMPVYYYEIERTQQG